MKNPNRVLPTLLVALLCAFQLHGQSTDCGEIKVSTKTISPDQGRSNGSIELVFEASANQSQANKYKVFLLNAGSERAKYPIEENKIKDLKAGFYDILIVDKKGCNKQLTVTLRDK